MSGAALAELVRRTFGVDCTVEEIGRLAVVTPQVGAERLLDPETRARLMEAGRAHGFTHVAVELTGVGAGRESAAGEGASSAAFRGD